jgi:hypothetical protein
MTSEAREFYLKLQDDMRERELAQYKERGWEVTRPTDVHTVGDLVGAIMSIDNADDARRFYEGAVEDIQAQIDAGTWDGRDSAEAAARSNIGWCYGEAMPPDRVTMWRLVTGAEHPWH